ncbi:unnamed protein product, partial [Polarella glacialis]
MRTPGGRHSLGASLSTSSLLRSTAERRGEASSPASRTRRWPAATSMASTSMAGPTTSSSSSALPQSAVE